MRFDLIAPANLHAVWPYVRTGLARVLLKTPERWLPEDVFTHLRVGVNKAQLYLGYDGAQCRGFFITNQQLDQFNNSLCLNVWVLWAEPTSGEHCADISAFVTETLEFIDALARQVGAKRVSLEGRPGWARFLRGHFEPIRTRFEREL